MFDLQQYKSAISIPMAPSGPAPTVIQSGWTDTLFPVNEALHYVNAVKASGAKTPLLLVFDDVGHPWAQEKPGDYVFNNETGIAFLDSVVLQQRTPQTGALVRRADLSSQRAVGPDGERPFVECAREGLNRDRRNGGPAGRLGRR